MASLRWRLGFVVVFSLLAATEVLAQRDVFEYWGLAAILSGFADYYVQCLCYGVAILLAVMCAERLLPRLPPAARPLALGLAILGGAVTGGVLDVALHDLGYAYFGTTRFVGDVLPWSTTGVVIVGIYAYQLRASAAAVRVHEAALEQVALDRQMLEARLQVMRAQIEPHFLFNSLANAKRLCQHDLGRGLTMLENLARYLRAALPQLRSGATTLGQEADLVHAYLGILQIRMGEYLAYSLDVPDAVRDIRFPPMMLLTLAENAIKHGLAPSPEAGRIDIIARRHGDELVVSVADTGVGFGAAKTGGTGIGLANTRSRLSALYGAGAELELTANTPRGVVARIRVVLAQADTPLPVPAVA
jgi:hypothetical protein